MRTSVEQLLDSAVVVQRDETRDEKAEVVANCDRLAELKFSKVLPFTFTEHGAIQAADVLASAQAVEMGIFVVRAFVRMRELASVQACMPTWPSG